MGMLALAGTAWIIARRLGVLAGLVLPGLAVLGALVRQGVPPGHAEEVMGRGLEVIFLWVPLIVLTLTGAALGLYARRKAGRGK